MDPPGLREPETQSKLVEWYYVDIVKLVRERDDQEWMQKHAIRLRVSPGG